MAGGHIDRLDLDNSSATNGHLDADAVVDLLRRAIAHGTSLRASGWSRPNVLAQVPKGSSEMVAAAIRTIFAQPKADMVRDQLEVMAGPKLAVPRRGPRQPAAPVPR